TVASAKVGNDPNSATHDFFFNQEDANATNLDNQNAGFTVFGRVAGSGMSIVDNIIALPQRTYTDVIVDGSTSTFANWPMNDVSAPTTMDITKTVKITDASEIPVLTYSISNNTTPAVATAVVNGSNVQVTGLTDGATDITVQAADLDGNTTSQTFTITVQSGFIAPSITTQPVSQAIVAGSTATLSVVAIGTDLGYQWRKDGNPLIGEVGSSLEIADFQAANEGDYDVVLTNAATSITSSVATLSIKTTPGVTAPTPDSVFIAAGQPLNLQSTVTGSPAPAITWTRNNRLLLGQTSATLNIPSAALTDAGAYRVKAKNTTAVTSAPATVNVVDASGARIVIASNKTATMKVLIKGTGPFSYQWRKGATNLTESTTIRGVTNGTLTLRNCDFSSAGLYACNVTGPDGLTVIDCGPYDLRVVTKPVLSNFTAPTAFVGAGYSFVVPYSAATTSTPTSFVITGLPPGMKYNKATGEITGRPTRAGSFTLKVKASNPAGSSALVTATLLVVPLDSYTIGSFVGLFARQTDLNRDTGGRMDLSVSDSGAYSGKINLAGVTYAVKGTVDVRSDGSIQAINTIVRKNLPTLTFGFVVDTTSGGLSGTITDGTHNSELLGWRQFWSSKFLPSYFAANNTTAETYSMAMDIPAGSVGNPAIPQGTGFASIKVSTSGIATISGKTIDGNTITCSGIVGPSGQIAVFQPLYKNTGGLLGPLQLVTGSNGYTKVTTLTATGFDHAKQPGPSTDRSYQAGFAPVALAVVGGPYRAPGKNVRIMGLTTGTPSATLSFSEGGLDDATIIDLPGISFDLSATNKALLPKAGTAGNPAKVSLSINTASGLISGAFTVVAPTPDTGDDPSKTVSRTSKIMGRLVPTGSAASSYTLFGIGQFQLTDLANPRSGPILTGNMSLDPTTP
ncbi:MAG: immunoglobulin domain-containing protein, partial [Verrucomicrobiales bacterium]|nr:immunoglobulin domain-containing protein [Verrucomicrobiales bacterium]